MNLNRRKEKKNTRICHIGRRMCAEGAIYTTRDHGYTRCCDLRGMEYSFSSCDLTLTHDVFRVFFYQPSVALAYPLCIFQYGRTKTAADREDGASK